MEISKKNISHASIIKTELIIINHAVNINAQINIFSCTYNHLWAKSKQLDIIISIDKMTDLSLSLS